ncbi:MAG: hypothetical protein K8R21_10250, partial [Leptospira sp.]|nr:hypothetical protein [Leptospira sp.]
MNLHRFKQWVSIILSPEWRLLTILSTTAILFTIVFFCDLNRSQSFGTRKIIGNITFKKNTVQRKFDNQVVWGNLENESPLSNKDSIRSA